MKHLKDSTLFKIWGALFILCALLGFIPEPTGFGKALLVLLALGFFVPGGILLYRGVMAKDRGRLRLIRSLSLLWLGLTLLVLVINFQSVSGSETAGALLYGLLVVASSPMICGQYWSMSLFIWASFLMLSLSQLGKLKKQ